jgi:hypothetical protein
MWFKSTPPLWMSESLEGGVWDVLEIGNGCMQLMKIPNANGYA